MAYQDGELASRRASKVAKHIQRCSGCRRELERIQAEVRQFQTMAPPLESSHLERSLQNLLMQVRAWPNTCRDAVRPKIQKQFAFQIEILFGSRTAATREWAGAQQDGPDPIAAAEPLLSACLGKRAAELLASRAFEGIDLGADPVAEPTP